MDQAVIYIHGKGGTPEEAEHYRPLCRGCDVFGMDYKSETPWDAKREFPVLFDRLCEGYASAVIIANSIGAFFAMHALRERKIKRAFFISPVVNMAQLIADTMARANVTEDELHRRREIPTAFGETLSWEYLCYVRDDPVVWHVPTAILYGAGDSLTSYAVVSEFAGKTGASLTVMENGEHWFHTNGQMAFLDNWLKRML